MAYAVEFSESVMAYLEGGEGLTAESLELLYVGMREELGRDADRFLALRPLSRESLHFRYDYAVVCGGAVYDFDFVVDGESLEMGVVRVIYVERVAVEGT